MYEIIVTGASGFIGSNLCKILNDNKADFLAISSLNIKDYPSKIFTSFSDIPKSKILVYLSENNDIRYANLKGEEYIYENLKNLRQCIKSSKARIIYASSSSVYSDMENKILKPSDLTLPNSIYEKSKLKCEREVIELGGTVARISNVYGIGMSSSNVISEIVSQLKNKKITINDGSPVRDFINVQDVADCIYKMAINPSSGTYNIASGDSISISELSKLILEITKKSEIKIVSKNNSSKVSEIRLDIKSTMETYNWKPSYNIKQGIKSYLALSKHARIQIK